MVALERFRAPRWNQRGVKSIARSPKIEAKMVQDGIDMEELIHDRFLRASPRVLGAVLSHLGAPGINILKFFLMIQVLRSSMLG